MKKVFLFIIMIALFSACQKEELEPNFKAGDPGVKCRIEASGLNWIGWGINTIETTKFVDGEFAVEIRVPKGSTLWLTSAQNPGDSTMIRRIFVRNKLKMEQIGGDNTMKLLID